MGIKKYKPTTPVRRWTAVSDFSEITKKRPEKSLTQALRKSGGRNNHGHITSAHRGGGHKRRYRLIDFKRARLDDSATVLAIEYDPNRSSRIALIQYPDGVKNYIIHPVGLAIGDTISSGPNAEIKPGCALPIKSIPPGTAVHNLELEPGRGAAMVRSAGASATIMAKEGNYAHIRLPSGEVRLVRLDCYATIGQVGNVEHDGISLGKAGRSRWLGRRPYSRGVVKNPVDHPMGGGEGKSSGGRHPCSKTGQCAKGLKTRKKKKQSNKYIVRRRVSKRAKKAGQG